MIRSITCAALLAVALPGLLPAQRAVSAATVPASAAAPTAADTMRRSTPIPAPAAEAERGLLTFEREAYAYAAGGRRDPFVSLLASGDIRPLIGDLRLAVITYDERGGSVAVLRDLNTGEQYRVRTGQQIGRMRVAAIHPKRVVFTIEEFGFSRQETLSLSDTNTARTQQ